jgi:hypothetical protein
MIELDLPVYCDVSHFPDTLHSHRFRHVLGNLSIATPTRGASLSIRAVWCTAFSADGFFRVAWESPISYARLTAT